MDISIIIPVYNVEEYLRECLDSVSANIKYLDAEVLLVDDGSTDQSSEIAKSYADHHKKFRYFFKENGGSSLARNYGVERAAGKYIFFMDSDDILADGILPKMLAAAKMYASDITTCDVAKLQEGKMVGSAIHLKAFYNLEGVTSNAESHPNLIYDCNACNKLIRREFYLSHELSFPPGRLYEDIPVLTRAYCMAERVSVIRQVGYIWRIRPKGERSNTQSYHERKSLTDKIEMITDVLRYLDEYVNSSAIRKAVENKAVKVDFTGFINRLEEMPKEDASWYVDQIADFIRNHISAEVISDLPVIYRQTCAYILDGNLDALTRLVRYKLTNFPRTPIVQTEDGLEFRLREELFTVQGRLIDREFIDEPPRCMVDSAKAIGTMLELKGHVYTRRINIPKKEDQIISAYMMEEVSGKTLELPAESCECHYLTEEQGTVMNYDDYDRYHYNYDGTGFSIRLDLKELQSCYPDVGDCVIFIRFSNAVIQGERLLRGIRASARQTAQQVSHRYDGKVKTVVFDQRDTMIIRTQESKDANAVKRQDRRKKIKKTVALVRSKRV